MKKALVFFLVLAIVLVTVSSLVGCKPKEVEKIGFYANGSTGLSFEDATALAAMVNKYSTRVSGTAVAGVSLENLVNTINGQIKVGGSIDVFTAVDAYNGEGEWSKYPESQRKSLRVVKPGPNNGLHVYALKSSGIKSFADIKGKKISTMEKKGITAIVDDYMLDISGLRAANTVRYDSSAAQLDAIRDGQVDVAVMLGGMGGGGREELAATKGINFISLPEDVLKAMETWKGGALSRGVMPAKTYSSQTEPVNTVMDVNWWMATTALSDDLVYDIVKAFWDHPDEVKKMSVGMAKITDPEMVKKLPIPYHPGAEKYYREKGYIK